MDRKTISKALDRYPGLFLLPILAVFSLVSWGNINRWSIWFDEAFTAYINRFDFMQIVHYTALDVHPPLHYWLTKVWTSLFGVSEVGFRSLSLVFALVTLVGVYFLISRLFSKKQAIWAVGLVALAPILLRFSNEARAYTLVSAIVVWATYVLVLIRARPTKWRWLAYALLISAGMWTHYFTALFWLAHWVWRFVDLKSNSSHKFKKFFSKGWVVSHVIAVGLFLPWIPTVIKQFASVQGGFWIPDFGVYSLIDFVSNGLIYQEYGRLINWQALLFLVMAILMAVVLGKFYTIASSNKKLSSGAKLLTIMTIVPPIILVILSLPPLTSSFIDRYIVPSILFLLMLMAVGLSTTADKFKKLSVAASLALIATMVVGIVNVYHYGNYNKNVQMSVRVREAIDLIDDRSASHKAPILVTNTGLYYEAAFYDQRDRHVFFLDSSTDYKYGSEKMLQENSTGKVVDQAKFSENHPRVWYLFTGDSYQVDPPVKGWQPIDKLEVHDNIDNVTRYRAILYKTN